MKKTLEITAKSVEEAIEQAVAQFGAPSADDIKVTVIREAKKGFWGLGSTQAVISAEYDVPDAEMDLDTEAVPEAEFDIESKTNSQESGTAYPEATHGELVAYEFIKKIIVDMEIEATVTMKPGTNDDVVISVDGEGAGMLIGHHGETLDSLQYLANLAANRREEGDKHEYARITVDIEDYRAKREAALRSLARKKAMQVQKYKKSIMLEPMNPYERRIIHSEVQNIEGVSTNSIGVDNNRRIVIYLEESGIPTSAPKKSRKKSSSADLTAMRSKNNIPSAFSEDDVKDPFDIDLSAALPQEDYDNEE